VWVSPPLICIKGNVCVCVWWDYCRREKGLQDFRVEWRRSRAESGRTVKDFHGRRRRVETNVAFNNYYYYCFIIIIVTILPAPELQRVRAVPKVERVERFDKREKLSADSLFGTIKTDAAAHIRETFHRWKYIIQMFDIVKLYNIYTYYKHTHTFI